MNRGKENGFDSVGDGEEAERHHEQVRQAKEQVEELKRLVAQKNASEAEQRRKKN